MSDDGDDDTCADSGEGRCTVEDEEATAWCEDDSICVGFAMITISSWMVGAVTGTVQAQGAFLELDLGGTIVGPLRSAETGLSEH
ncbi:BQ5605_C016g08058 [Microbotryum silenes-dioicae]|uniref:BQ5605_C016g08058 protein n=1 Tax=Microbotryum silenes-dioicae TaxID=796604 RepID=A0A2X0LVD1_9BASI|nr:BQ5605_C016g08058 [Microbotryum silenes-dioicae]